MGNCESTVRTPRAWQERQSPSSPPPPTELHTIPRHKMIAYLKRLGGHVLAVNHRVEATPHHPSYRYFVTK